MNDVLPDSGDNQPTTPADQPPASPSTLTVDQIAALEYPIVTDGKTEQRTVKELAADAQMRGAAANRLRENTELLTTNKHKLELADTLMKANAGDSDAIIATCKMLGYDDSAINEMMSAMEEAMGGSSSTKPTDSPTSSRDPRLTDDMAGQLASLEKVCQKHGFTLPEMLNKLGEGINAQNTQGLRSHIRDRLSNTGDTKPYMTDTTSADALVDIVSEFVTSRQAQAGGKLSESMVTDALKEVATIVTKLGDAKPAGAKGPDGLSLGTPSSAFGMSDQEPERPKERPPITDTEKHSAWMLHVLKDIQQRNAGPAGTS